MNFRFVERVQGLQVRESEILGQTFASPYILSTQSSSASSVSNSSGGSSSGGSSSGGSSSGGGGVEGRVKSC